MFIKIDPLRQYSFQLYQKHISLIRPKTINEVLVELNKITISEVIEDLEKIRQDSTTIESDIHHPPNNSLIWDCIRKSNDHLKKLPEEVSGLSYRDYTKGAKKTFFKTNNTSSKDKRIQLFTTLLQVFTKSIKQVSNLIKKAQLR